MLFAMPRLSQIAASPQSHGWRGHATFAMACAPLGQRFFFCLLAAWFLVATLTDAQMNTGEIGGTVKDPSSASLAGAAVVAEQAGTGLKFTAVADASGEYLLAQLPRRTQSDAPSEPCSAPC